MRRMFLLAVVVALAAPAVSAREIRHDAVPDMFWGTWAPGTDACKEKDKPIVLSKKAYAGPAGTCDIDYVTEIPGRGGAIYSARMRCSGSGAGAPGKTIANLIIRSEDGGKISAGPTFESLVAYGRCPADGAKQ